MNGGVTVAHKIEIDLNGTGTLVDVTAYVDQSIGLKYTTGRTDWTQAEPAPGVLTLTFDNRLGQFTPGNTTATGSPYVIGMRPGLIVKWTVTGDSSGAYSLPLPVRFFATGTPELVWNGDSGGGGSTVIVACTDALSKLAARVLKSMLAEHVMAADPVAYYPLTESGSAVTGAADISGFGQPAMIPSVLAVDDIQWGSATGPPTDGHGSLQLRSSDTAANVTAGLTMQTQADGDNGMVGPLGVPFGTYGVNTGQPFQDATYPGDRIAGVSFWFTINDIYGGTFAPTHATDGPYVSLLHLDNQVISPTWAGGIDVVWCVSDRKIRLFIDGNDGVLTLTSDAVSPTALHHLAFTIRASQGAPYNFTVQAYLDSRQQTAATIALNVNPWRPSNMVVRGLKCGWFSAGVSVDEFYEYYTWRQYSYFGVAANRVYALSGGISHISVHGAPIVYLDSATNSAAHPALWNAVVAGLPNPWPCDAYAIGAGQSNTDTAATRVKRFSGYNTDLSLVINSAAAFSGTARTFALGVQNTEGQSLLTALSTALRAEDATLASFGVLNGTYKDTIAPIYSSLLRQRTPLFTIDADADAYGGAAMAFDTSGAVTQVTATGAGITAVYNDTTAALIWPFRAVTIDSALIDPTNLMDLAQYRASVGQPTRIGPSKILLDLKTAKQVGFAAALFGGMDNVGTYVGATVNVTNLPSAVLGSGYTSALCLIVGIAETYDLERSTWELQLMPFAGEDYYSPVGLYGTNPAVVGGGQFSDSSAPTGLSMSAGLAYWLSYTTLSGYALSTTATYPLYMRCEAEVVRVDSVLSSGVAGAYTYQLVGITKGFGGTADVAHPASITTQNCTLVSSANVPVADPSYLGF